MSRRACSQRDLQALPAGEPGVASIGRESEFPGLRTSGVY